MQHITPTDPSTCTQALQRAQHLHNTGQHAALYKQVAMIIAYWRGVEDDHLALKTDLRRALDHESTKMVNELRLGVDEHARLILAPARSCALTAVDYQAISAKWAYRRTLYEQIRHDWALWQAILIARSLTPPHHKRPSLLAAWL